MPAVTAEVLTQRARDGEKLDAEQRRRCVAYLSSTEPSISNVEMADIFKVSEKTIREDKQKIREEVADEIETDDIRLVIADLKIHFSQHRTELEKGKRASHPGTKLHLDYVRALLDLDLKVMDAYQRLGLLPSNIGAMVVNEYNFAAIVAKGDKVDTKRIEEFDEETQQKIRDRRRRIPAAAPQSVIDIEPEMPKAVIPVSNS